MGSVSNQIRSTTLSNTLGSGSKDIILAELKTYLFRFSGNHRLIMALKSGAAFTVWGMNVLPQIVSASLHVSCDMVWLEKSSSLHPSSCPSANLRSKKVWMMGSCHRKKCNFWQDLNSYSFYKSC